MALCAGLCSHACVCMSRCSLALTLLAGVCGCRQVAGGVRALESGLLPRRRAVLAAVPLVAGTPRALAIAAPQASAVTVAASAVPPSAAAEFWSGPLAGAVKKTVKELLEVLRADSAGRLWRRVVSPEDGSAAYELVPFGPRCWRHWA